MKNLSLTLNGVLFVLVAVLFYLHFSSYKPKSSKQVVEMSGKSVDIPQIAYIDIDSFQTNYAFFKAKKNELEARQKAMESELDRSVSAFQAKIAKLQQQAATMTEAEGMAAQEKLVIEQQKIEERKQTMEMQFMKETQDFNLKLQEKIIDYLKEYNADGKYTYILPYSRETINLLYVNEANNITSEVLDGMNKDYVATKK